MVETASTMLPLGTSLPSFELGDVVTGTLYTDKNVTGEKATLVMFICNHCPFVKHVVGEIGRVANDYIPKGIGVVAINSNDVTNYPQDAPPQMLKLARSKGWKFPFLYDEAQDVAKSFKAACTPDFFLFDGENRLVYRGQLDDSRPVTGVPVTGRDLRAAIDALLEGKPVSTDQKPSIGCNIKWKADNAPSYFG